MADTLQGLVDTIVSSTAGLPDPETLASWNPEFSGDIDIVIRSDGRWEHAKETIHREGLVRLFASLLRREEDGDYYLVTPAEKWRLQVEKHALQAIDCDHRGTNGDGAWYVLLNTGGQCRIGGDRVLHPADDLEPPWISLPNGLSGQLTRAAWYRLVEAASIDQDRAFIRSGDEIIELGKIA